MKINVDLYGGKGIFGGRETPCLYVTDGTNIFSMRWKRDPHWQRFENGSWYIEPGINADGYWWADIVQTVRTEQKFNRRKI